MSIFDGLAETWDDKPDRAERTATVAERLRSALDFTGIESGLEYGCGTGQLSFALAEQLPHCLLVDTSVEMLKAAERGIVERNLPWDTERRNFATRAVDHPVAITDVIFSLQVLHHVDDLPTTLENMAKALRPGGQVALIDLPKGSSGFHHGSAHSHDDNPHLDGLDNNELEQVMGEAGFTDITWHEDIALKRTEEDGTTEYTLFLVTAKTPRS
ncbi:MAG: class I SAM-dependent methyltransferase [Propionibacteriaceae bacterium]|nr:class I SAM-dependent methyltransferase [Propionibacteriaceae bacterium]